MLLVFLLQAIRIAIPYLFAAPGGVVAERAGVVSLTLEGFMLRRAFCAALGSYYSGSAGGVGRVRGGGSGLGGAFSPTMGSYCGGGAWVGLLCGIAGGLVMGLLHA